MLGVMLQLGLVVLGLTFIFITEDHETAVLQLLSWCLLGSIYWVAIVVSLSLSTRRPSDDVESFGARFEASRVSRAIATVATFLSSAMGLGAASELIVLRNEPQWQGAIEFIAVWAMVLSWGLFHWGYAQIYYHRYYASSRRRPLEFPLTPEPRWTDFVYFSFTNGTNFSVSDVVVVDSRMRWTVIWHTTFSFFLNALIIVLTVNTIMSGDVLTITT
ncbi:hypothetical protein PA7_21020 [Pseudonocardia asaccharolytica DSM 44247 = NBRC 16224]|uniref:DUF1345 domain-containing protein n=1 Tax=Pseudonocardia asaccharolytica DSM 44247 = NBRC 16224 TaxID=1123024 RepID=A0A511D0E0_9PSEU|nr:hypothetical protein PA7_21020 [Pseudonocardia asaccharolytica DSM 44247 = NBRC 16224]